MLFSARARHLYVRMLCLSVCYYVMTVMLVSLSRAASLDEMGVCLFW